MFECTEKRIHHLHNFLLSLKYSSKHFRFFPRTDLESSVWVVFEISSPSKGVILFFLYGGGQLILKKLHHLLGIVKSDEIVPQQKMSIIYRNNALQMINMFLLDPKQ